MSSMSQNVLMMGKIAEDPPLTKNMSMGIRQLRNTKTKQNQHRHRRIRQEKIPCLNGSFLLTSNVEIDSVSTRHSLALYSLQ